MAPVKNLQLELREILDFLRIGDSIISFFSQARYMGLFDESNVPYLYDSLQKYLSLTFRCIERNRPACEAVLDVCDQIIRLVVAPDVICKFTSLPREKILEWKAKIENQKHLFNLRRLKTPSSIELLKREILQLIEDIHFEEKVRNKTLLKMEKQLNEVQNKGGNQRMMIKGSTCTLIFASRLNERFLALKSYANQESRETEPSPKRKNTDQDHCNHRSKKSCMEIVKSCMELEIKRLKEQLEIAKQAQEEMFDKSIECDTKILRLVTDRVNEAMRHS